MDTRSSGVYVPRRYHDTLRPVSIHRLITHPEKDAIVNPLRRALDKYRREGAIGLLASLADTILGAERLDPAYAALIKRRTGHVTHHGIQLDLEFECIEDEVRARFVRGSYESVERLLVDRYVPSDTDVIELGGGVGFISCTLNRQLEEGRTHVVVEANEDLVAVLERTRSLNDASFVIEAAAYAPEAKQTRFQTGPVVTAGKSVDAEDGDSVATTNLRDLRDLYDVDDFTLVVDIEGSEYDLVDRESDILSEHCSFVLAELHDVAGREWSEFVDGLRAAGFKVIDRRHGVVVARNE